MKKVTAIISLLFLLIGCNPVRFAARQQKQSDAIIQSYVAAHPPRIDTVTKFLPGKLIEKPYPVLTIDSNRMHEMADSINQVQAARYSTGLDDCNRQVAEAFNAGFQQAAWQASMKRDTIHMPDTIVRTVYNTGAVDALQKELTIATTQRDGFKDNYHITRITLYGCVALLAIVLFLYIKKLLK